MTIEHIKTEFTATYERENDALFRFCLWRVTNREVALEITQETFTRLWQRMVERGVQEHARAFIYLVARNMIIDWYRKSKSSSLDAMTDDEDRAFDPKDEHTHEDMETHSDATRVLRLLEQVGEQYRDIVYMRFVEDLPPREIAKVLGISANAVSVRLSRGLEELRKLAGINKLDEGYE